MEKKKNILIIGLITIIVLLLAGFVALFATDTISFNFSNKSKSESTNVIDNNGSNVIESKFDVNDYIVVENEEFEHSEFDVKRISFKNLDTDLTKEFLEKYEEYVIKYAHNSDSNYGNLNLGETYSKTNKLIYQINGSILTIYYEVESGASNTYTGCVTSDTLNIDLDNNRLLSNAEVLKMADGSFEEIANEEYERELKFLNEDHESYFMNWDQKEVGYEEFKNSKDDYINLIVGKLEDVINAYIEDGIVKYEYTSISLPLTYMQIGKGGCFSHETVTLGKMK